MDSAGERRYAPGQYAGAIKLKPDRKCARARAESETGVSSENCANLPSADDLIGPSWCLATQPLSTAERQIINAVCGENVRGVEIGVAPANAQVGDIAN